MQCLFFLLFYTSSISYSLFLLIISGGNASSMYCPLNWSSLHHVSRSLLNTLCIAYSFGNFSWNVSCSISFVISKDLYLFWFSFFESYFDWIFFSSNYMLFPCFNPWEFCLFLLNCFFIAFFALFIDDFAIFQLLCSFLRKVSSFGNSVFIVRSSFYECLPKLSSNGIYSVAECFLLLYWNSVANNYSV